MNQKKKILLSLPFPGLLSGEKLVLLENLADFTFLHHYTLSVYNTETSINLCMICAVIFKVLTIFLSPRYVVLRYIYILVSLHNPLLAQGTLLISKMQQSHTSYSKPDYHIFLSSTN